ncbi:hypothetical protein EYF80_032221 [Liparis tanakae]|uniref:Uncharacterized protein n=1 Tax=Liparis tanakae TaxID=230148 RepID=A0A4Z2GWT2_9TELE|nr:hypothetical protein EYF80_032221 [Liparis tanakae]
MALTGTLWVLITIGHAHLQGQRQWQRESSHLDDTHSAQVFQSQADGRFASQSDVNLERVSLRWGRGLLKGILPLRAARTQRCTGQPPPPPPLHLIISGHDWPCPGLCVATDPASLVSKHQVQPLQGLADAAVGRLQQSREWFVITRLLSHDEYGTKAN